MVKFLSVKLCCSTTMCKFTPLLSFMKHKPAFNIIHYRRRMQIIAVLLYTFCIVVAYCLNYIVECCDTIA